MKTPKRKYYFYESGINPDNGDVVMDAVTPELYETRWKRKNKIAQLKRTITRLHDKLEGMDDSRKIARRHLGCIRDFFLTLSRRAETAEGKVYWLGKTCSINLILGITVREEELDAQFRGEPTPPFTLEYTEEERELLGKFDEELTEG